MRESARNLERDHSVEFLCFFELGFAEEVMVLQAHPIFRLVAEVATELQAVLRGEQAATREDVVEQLRADVDVCGELRLCQAVVFQKIPQHGGGGVGQWDPGGFCFHGFNGNR